MKQNLTCGHGSLLKRIKLEQKNSKSCPSKKYQSYLWKLEQTTRCLYEFTSDQAQIKFVLEQETILH